MTLPIPSDLFASPRLFPLDVNLGADAAYFLSLSRADYARHSFLDTRIGPEVRNARALALPALLDAHTEWRATNPERRPLRYILHTAFCASTLLARCLDHPGVTLVLKEPLSLHRVSGIQRNRLAKAPAVAHVTDERWGGLLALTVDLLGRTFDPGEQPLVKTTDSTNHVLPHLLAHDARSRAILLYSDLTSFVVSSLKAPQRRTYTRNLLWRATVDAGQLGVFADVDATALSDAQGAAFVWAVQIAVYQSFLGTGHPNVRSLDSAVFLADPEATLGAAAGHFGFSLTPEHIRSAVTSTMRKHAKVPTADYSPDDAAAERAGLESRLADEIAEACGFLDSLGASAPISLPLSAPLVA